MKLDHDRLLMSLAKTEAEDNAEHTLSNSKVDQMLLLPEQDQLPAKVANVSRDELRKFVQCKRVGNYLLGKTVGEGSFAKVKEALHILTGEKVAIKIIDKNRARKDKYVSKNMRREARLLQMVRHPHIVQLLEIVETSQCYYLVFEFADGGELMDYICRRKKLEEEEVRKFIRQIISAVEYLHRLGIIHRDLKVENLLLDVKKNIKIIDFGLSNTIYSPDPKNENHCSTQCGSPAYAAPELLVRKDYGPQIDVWSIGVNLYAMLTGRLPYTVEPFNISALYNKMLKKEMNVIPEYLSEGCKDFIHQLLNPNPKERITLQEAAKHRWITNSQRDPLLLTTCPNYLSEEDLEDNILDHVENQLKLNSDDVIRDVIQNRATKNSCVYHLLLRRLERYRRDYGDVITPPAKSKMEEERRVSQRYEQTLTTFKVSSQQNGIIQDQRAPAKPQIMENPFKTIKVTLIRQKNATNNAGISKPVTTDMSSSSTASHTPSRSESAHKHKLCPVKRVALVKVSPARRSFRPTLSSSRHSIRSPMTHRRKNYFEGLQHRRKSPKVRRRHAELDDSQSSVGSNSTKRNDVHIKKSPQEASHRRSENKPSHKSHRDRNFKNVESKVTTEKCVTECANEKPRGQLTPLPTTEVDGKTLETVTHFYTDKGVALKRNSTGTNGKVDSDIDTENERKSVQHHVFHSNGEVSMEDTMDTHESQRNNGDGNGKSTVETSGKHKEPDIRVVNAKISSIPVRSLERLQPISPRINSSCTPTSQAKDPSETEPSPSRVFDEKSVTSKRSSNGYFSSSKIPIPAAKGPPGHQSPPSPACLAPKSPSPSTAKDHPSRTAETKDELPTSGDKYTKCFSVIVVNRPSTMKELGAIKNSGAEDQSANAKKNESGVNSGTAITITDEENGRQMKANENVKADLPRIRKAITRSKSQEPPRLSAGEKQSESSPKDNKGNGQDLISKKLVKCNETSKNKNVDRKLPKMKESSGQHQSAKAKEVRKTHSWGGDERRKISNYRKTTDTQQTKVTVRRDSRTPPTSHKVHSFKNGS